MNSNFSYENLADRANVKTKPKQIANIITYTVVGIGLVLFWVGMLLFCANPNDISPFGLVIVIIGLLLIAFSYPLHRFVFGKLIKKRLDAFIKVLDN